MKRVLKGLFTIVIPTAVLVLMIIVIYKFIVDVIAIDNNKTGEIVALSILVFVITYIVCMVINVIYYFVGLFWLHITYGYTKWYLAMALGIYSYLFMSIGLIIWGIVYLIKGFSPFSIDPLFFLRFFGTESFSSSSSSKTNVIYQDPSSNEIPTIAPKIRGVEKMKKRLDKYSYWEVHIDNPFVKGKGVIQEINANIYNKQVEIKVAVTDWQICGAKSQVDYRVNSLLEEFKNDLKNKIASQMQEEVLDGWICKVDITSCSYIKQNIW